MNRSAINGISIVPEPQRPPIPARFLQLLVLFHAIALSVASFYFVFENAADEPFLAFVPGQAMSQIGGPVAVVVLWTYLAGAVVFGVTTRRLAPSWLLVIALAVAGVALVLQGPSAYIEDLFKFQAVKPAY
ncbi:hypothetical protein ACXR0O_20155 [Verrucomicrobiota bacterium sgz303538]